MRRVDTDRSQKSVSNEKDWASLIITCPAMSGKVDLLLGKYS